MCFGREKSRAEILELSRENYRRIGENFACAVKTASMTAEEVKSRLELAGDRNSLSESGPQPSTSRVFAIGHFGNFEVFAHAVQMLTQYQGATTYRALKSPRLNRLLLSLREHNHCLLFERRTQGAELREALRTQKLLLGLFSDQHGGDAGVRLPFFGHECSTGKAPAIFALRYGLPLHTCICYRTSLARWRIEISDAIPTHRDGQPRPAEEIMLDVNRAFEKAVRRDPANWFWVHKRWKPGKGRAASINLKPGSSTVPSADPEL